MARNPTGHLLLANDGNFYTTTRAGGSHLCRSDNIPCGAVVRIAPSGDEAVLYSFGASATDGYGPNGPVIQGRDGALYGTTSSGGTFGGGTLFKISLSGAYSVWYSFGASSTDGVVPTGGLVQASDGSFYGTTTSGGANHCTSIPQAGGNCGTVFRMLATGAVSTLHSFGASSSDGVEPLSSLIVASDGNLYGTTLGGGAGQAGTLFKISPTGAESVVYSFGSSSGDGAAPQGALVQGADGALYGTTISGGAYNCGSASGCGTVFRVTLAGAETLLWKFGTPSLADGSGPSPFLTLGTDGNFYGTTRSGGQYQCVSCGTVFRLTPAGVKTTLYSFGPVNQNPNDPGAGITQGNDGAFFGVTFSGPIGSLGGTVFKLVAP